jgi:hypothetical protein
MTRYSVPISLFAFAWTCFAQGQPELLSSTISGTVRGVNSAPIAPAIVTLHQRPPYSPARLLQTEWVAVTKPDGSFKFEGLRRGTYRLCAQSPGTVWLNPCEWGPQSPDIVLSDTERDAHVPMVLKQGAVVSIRLEDPAQLSSSSDALSRGGRVLLGVANDARVFRPATRVSKDGTGENYEVVVPFSATVTIVVHSSSFELSDSAGVRLPQGSARIPLNVEEGKPIPRVRLNIIGQRN